MVLLEVYTFGCWPKVRHYRYASTGTFMKPDAHGFLSGDHCMPFLVSPFGFLL